MNLRINEIQQIVDKLNDTILVKQSSDNYNVFNILGIGTDEVSTHSKFIAEMLNPFGLLGKKQFLLYQEYLKVFYQYLNFPLIFLNLKKK